MSNSGLQPKITLKFDQDARYDPNSLMHAKFVKPQLQPLLPNIPQHYSVLDAQTDSGRQVDPAITNAIQSAIQLFSKLSDQNKSEFLSGLISHCTHQQIAKLRTDSKLFSKLPQPIPQTIDSRLSKNVPPVIHPTKSSTSTMNANMYKQLFPCTASSNSQAIKKPKQVLTHLPGPDISKFTSELCSRLDLTLAALNNASTIPSAVKRAEMWMQSLSHILKAQNWSIYKVYRMENDLDHEFPLDASITVYCSNWQSAKTHVPFKSVFGVETLLNRNNRVLLTSSSAKNSANHQPPPAFILNVYEAASSTYNTNECNDRYMKPFQCVLSTLVSDRDNEWILEFVDKQSTNAVPESVLPFFDIDDEYIVQSTLNSAKKIVLEDACKYGAGAANDHIHVLTDLSLAICCDHDKVWGMIQSFVSKLVHAEVTSVVFVDASMLDSGGVLRHDIIFSEWWDQLCAGKSVLVAHAHGITKYLELGIRNMILVPITDGCATGAQVTGVLCARNKLREHGNFSANDVSNLSIYSPMISALLKQSRTTQERVTTINNLKAEAENVNEIHQLQDATESYISKNFQVITSPCTSLKLDSILSEYQHRQLFIDIKTALSTDVPQFGESYMLNPCSANAVAASQPDYVDYSVYPTNSKPQRLTQNSGGNPCEHLYLPQDTLTVPSVSPDPPIHDSTLEPSVPLNGTREVVLVIRKLCLQKRLAQLRSKILGGNEQEHDIHIVDPASLMNSAEQNVTVIQIRMELHNCLDKIRALSLFYKSVYKIICIDGGGIMRDCKDERVTCVFGLLGQSATHQDVARQAILSSLQLRIRLGAEVDSWFTESESVNKAGDRFSIVLVSGMVSSGALMTYNQTTYAIIGDPFSRALDMENLTQTYQSSVAMDKTTRDLVILGKPNTHTYQVRELDWVQLQEPRTCKTRSKVDTVPIPIYDVMGDHTNKDMRSAFICYELGLGEYRSGNMDAALSYFKKCQSLVPGDKPSLLMYDRCQMACENRSIVIPDDWNGIWAWA